MAKANKIRNAWIALKIASVSIKYSLICYYLCLFSGRTKVDRLIRTWSKAILDIVKVTYTIHNPYNVELLPGQTYILMSNHASHYDIPLIFMAFPGSIRMITKKELFRVPIWGYVIKKAEFLTIDRNNSKQAIKDLEIVREKMQSGIIPWIAPEGTRSRHGKLNPFKKGGFILALQTQATIIPIGIRGSSKILPPDTLNFSVGEQIEIYIDKPIATTEYTIETRNELIAEVRHRIYIAANYSD